MSNRFTRNIQNVDNIQNLPLYTNVQNDLISTDNMVYVRHNNAYEPILNKGVLGTGLTPEDVDRIKGIIDNKFKDYTEGAIKELNNDEITELEQSILNLIGDRLGGLKFDQDGFKTSLNEVLKRLELSEISDVQNLQREIEYAFDENNKSTSKKIDDVKSELSQMIDEKIGQVQTEDNPIISVETSLQPYRNSNGFVEVNIFSSVYTNKEINEDDLKIINISDESIEEVNYSDYGEITYQDNTIKKYFAPTNSSNYNTQVVVYKNKTIDIIDTGTVITTFEENDGRFKHLEKEIEDLKTEIENLKN